MPDQYPLAEWRLLTTGERDGATNMSIDEAILEAVTDGRARPTLRFFAWRPPCLSLGLGQSIHEIDTQECARRGWEMMRRPTGGQAILHVDELTYSVCAPVKEPRVAGGVVDSYHRLAAGLLAGLELMGLESPQAERNQAEGRTHRGPACFEGPARYEITHNERKLIGSAQSRRRGGVLQHGTLPLEGDITRIVDALAFEEPTEQLAARSRLHQRALTLETALGRRVSFAEAANAMAAGFTQALNLKLVPGELTAKELAAAQRIRAEKYSSDEWTFRK